MVGIVESLGDDLANSRPGLVGANSPYAIVIHCLGVLEFWGGAMVAGRGISRDRDTEFVATGSTAGLRGRVEEARGRFETDLAALDPRAVPAAPVDERDGDLPFGQTQAGVLIHVFHELAQHLGQLELTRDLLLAEGGPARP